MLNAAIVGLWLGFGLARPRWPWHNCPHRFRARRLLRHRRGRGCNAFAQRYGIAHAFADFADLLAMPDIDVVVICTPPALHYAMVRRALRAGKHVVCEKPLRARSRMSTRSSRSRSARRARAACRSSSTASATASLACGTSSSPASRAGTIVSSIETAKTRGADYYAVAWRGKFATELGGVLAHPSHPHP